MAHARAPPSLTPATPNDALHPSLIGIATAIEQSERDTKQRLGLAHELLGNIDAWAKTKAGTEDEAVVAPLIERLAPIVTEFAIGTAHINEYPCKNQYPKKSAVTAAAPRVSLTAEKPTHGLPEKPQVTQPSWVTVARTAARLPDPPAAPPTQKQAKSPPRSSPKEDKRLFLRLNKDHEWRNLSPSTLKKIIPERAGVAASASAEMYQVRSGMAFEWVSDALRESILRVASSVHQEKAIIEPASEWISDNSPRTGLSISNKSQPTSNSVSSTRVVRLKSSHANARLNSVLEW